ncbi:hypothetical protein CKAN_01760200 [Cinnamomum micranthum f. kanehirae]|uniref:Uncharacterized protein n=1 Tax=Cinnamomum micranthum f. kanehirae TaxID=337451 RepID=A0A3S4PCH8_9MAGN|nr:hypothetical protein CKAN_01760200 [Cinnamomum micranthum f. kanehirae]
MGGAGGRNKTVVAAVMLLHIGRCSDCLGFSMHLILQLSVKNPNILRKFGLRPKHVTLKRENSEGNLQTGEKLHPLSLKHPYILEKLGLQAKHVEVEHQKSAEDLPPDELLDLGLQHLAAGNQDKALPLLR